MPVRIIFDTETTGMFNKNAPLDHASQPHLLQLGAEVIQGGHVRAALDLLVNPGPDIEIPEEATKVHGIDREMVDRFGVSPVVAAGMFNNLLKMAQCWVGHNIDYDIAIMQILYHRLGRADQFREFRQVPRICTMRSATDFLKIPNDKKWSKYKWPKLIEAYKLLVDQKGFQAHSAIHDVQATRKVLFALEQRGVELIPGER